MSKSRLTFEQLYDKYNKNSEETNKEKVRLQKEAEIDGTITKLKLEKYEKEEAFEQSILTPGEDMIEAKEALDMVEAQLGYAINLREDLFGRPNSTKSASE